MTVVVYDGTTLAADRRTLASNSDILCAPRTKVFVTEHGAIASVGLAKSEEQKAKVLADLSSGDRIGFSNDLAGIALLRDGTAFMFIDGAALPVTPPHAMGSGHEVARGALAAGCDAYNAVRITNDLVVTCGDGIDTYSPQDAAA